MLKINWHFGYGNSPTITVEDSLDLLPREECEYTFKNGIWYHIQDNGLVRYFAHTGQDRNEGGFGGAAFTFLHNGEPKTLVGPWSSRASFVNTILPEDKQIVDIVLDNGRNRIFTGILVSKLVELWDQNAFLVRGLNNKEEEHGPITASDHCDKLIKPDGSIFDRNTNIQIFAEPVAL